MTIVHEQSARLYGRRIRAAMQVRKKKRWFRLDKYFPKYTPGDTLSPEAANGNSELLSTMT